MPMPEMMTRFRGIRRVGFAGLMLLAAQVHGAGEPQPGAPQPSPPAASAPGAVDERSAGPSEDVAIFPPGTNSAGKPGPSSGWRIVRDGVSKVE